MAASQSDLNPIYLDSASIKLLTQMAASDAKHDFGTYFLRIFSDFNEGFRYKEIGTSIQLDDKTPLEEHPTLNEIIRVEDRLKLHTADGKSWNPEIFQREPGGSGDDAYTSKEFSLNPVLSYNEPSYHKYLLQTRKFNEPTFTALKVFEFINNNFGKTNTIYVQQDAGNLSLNDKFRDAGNPGQDGTDYMFYYLNSREGVNDPAGKTNGESPVITDTLEKKIKVQIRPEKKIEKKDDTGNLVYQDGKPVMIERQIFYPRLPNSKLGRNASITNNFNSIYNIEISPIIVDEEKTIGTKKVKKTQRVCMYLRDEKNVVIGSTNKGKRENAINTLYSILTTFLNKMKKKEKETAPYFQALQQKRGGDWLQCLATFDKKRFDIQEKETVLLFTHDLICLSYALVNGINVLFSVLNGDNSYILLFKNVTTSADKGLIHYLDDIQNLKKGVDTDKVQLTSDLQIYSSSRKRLVGVLEGNITAAIAKFDSELSSLNEPSDAHRKIREIVRILIKPYFEYSFFTNMFPSEQTFISPYYDVQYQANGDATAKFTPDYTDSYAKFDEYAKYVLGLLKDSIFEGTITPDKESFRALFTKLKNRTKEFYEDKGKFYTDLENKAERELLEKINVTFAAVNTTTPKELEEKKKEIEKQLSTKIKELETFVSNLYNLKNRLKSYQVLLKASGGITVPEVNKLINLTKKIKSKDLDAISVFIDNFNPIPVDVKINEANDEVEKIFRPKNRFSIFTNLTGARKKHELEQQNEKSEVDYSVFNYFIGAQLPDAMKTTLITKLESINATFDTLKKKIDESPTLSSTIQTRKSNDMNATKKIYNYFLKETKFHLNKTTDWNYEMGLTTDILKKLDNLFIVPPIPNAPERKENELSGGASLSNEEPKTMIGGEVVLTPESMAKITEFLLENFGQYFPEDDKLNTEFLRNLNGYLISGFMRSKLKEKLPKLLTPPLVTINDNDYDTAVTDYMEFLNSEEQEQFDLIIDERTKLLVKEGVENATDPEALKRIVKNTKIGKAVVIAAAAAAEAAKALAETEKNEAKRHADAAEAKANELFPPAAPASKIAGEARDVVTKVRAAEAEAAAAKTTAETIWGVLEPEKNALVQIALDVENSTKTEIQAFGPPPPLFKNRVIDLSTKAKQILEAAKIATEKKLEASLGVEEIITKKRKEKVFNFISNLIRTEPAQPPAAQGPAVAPLPPPPPGPEISSAFEEEINDIFENYIEDENEILKLAKKDEKSENVILTTPETMYLDILMRYRDLHRAHFSAAENKFLDDTDEQAIAANPEHYARILSIFRGVLTEAFVETAEGGAISGGANGKPFSINDVNVPYLGWITLYFYGRSLLNEMLNTNHAEEGLDFPYLARQAQFFLSMEQSMYKNVLPPTQKGGGGPGSPNQSTGSTVMTVTSDTKNSPYTIVNSQKRYNSYIKQRGPEIQQLMKTYAIGTQCDVFLTNILPRLDSMEGAEAQQLKKAIFDAMQQGLGYGWIADFSAMQNDYFFGESADISINSEVDFKNIFLTRFINDTLTILKASPAYEINDENKMALQAKITASLARMVEFLRNTEHTLVRHMYQEVLISRLEGKIQNAKATRRNQRFNSDQKNRNTFTKGFNQIMSYTDAHFNDLQFLMKHGLVKQEGRKVGPGSLTSEFDSKIHSIILQSIPNGLERFKQIEIKLQANPELKQKYIQRIKEIEAYGKAKNRNRYNRAWKSLQSFIENPEDITLLNLKGGTRKQKGSRLKSRRRTHKKI